MINRSLAIIAVTGIAFAQPALAQMTVRSSAMSISRRRASRRRRSYSITGMLYQHSFWYRASQKTFEDVLKADPECGIAYWGIALSLLWNPHVPPPAKNLAEGAAAIAKAKSVGAKTQRERDYIDALAVMYADHDKVDHRTRIVAYAKAMEQLAQRYPKDDEAQIHYALSLNTSASPADKTYANQLKGAAILEPISKRQPHHPGVAHYLIHLYDYPPIAEKGLDAAGAMPRSRRLRRTPSTCRRTSSRASATGRNRSRPTPSRARREAGQLARTISCTAWTTWSMPICSSGRTRRPRP